MTTDSSNLSVAELEQLLDTRKTKLLELARLREKAVEEIAELDSQIHQLVDLRGVAKPRRIKRQVNDSTLRVVLLEVLKKNKKGFDLKNLADKIQETGYRSNSKNFTNVVYQAIYNTPEVQLDEKTGCYRLKK